MFKGILASPFSKIFVISLFCSWLTACGSAGTSTASSSVNSTPSSGGPKVTGIDGTGGELPGDVTKVTSIGTITTSDGITVNGVTFDAANASILINGTEASELQLNEGQIVTVNGQLSDSSTATGSADSITYNTTLKGIIQAIDQNEQTLTVLQQTIRLNDGPVFSEGNSLSTFVVGDLVEISAFKKENNELSASRVDKAINEDWIINGHVSQLNTDALSFSINGQTIDYSNVALVDELSNDLEVSVSGEAIASNKLIANQVSLTSSAINADTSRVEIEGFPTDIQDKFNFSINGIQVLSRYAVEYIGGDEDDLNANSKIEVEGTINSEGVLEAERIIYLVAQITSHTNEAKLDGETVVFEWNDIKADKYFFTLIDHNTKEEISNNELPGSQHSISISDLPVNGAPITVFLTTELNNKRSRRGYRLYGSDSYQNTVLTSHKNRDILTSTTESFIWSDVSADAYRLRIRNRNVIYDETFDGSITSTTVSNLPTNGAFLIVEIYSKHGKWWTQYKYDMTSTQLLENSIITSHDNDEKLKSGTETFTWMDVGADSYVLTLRSEGDFYTQEFPGNTLSATVSGLPENGSDIRVTISTIFNDASNPNYVVVKAAENYPHSSLTSHEQFQNINSSMTLFEWNLVETVDEYRIEITDRYDWNEVYFEEKLDPTTNSVVATGLPKNGSDIRVALYTYYKGFPFVKSYNFTTQVEE